MYVFFLNQPGGRPSKITMHIAPAGAAAQFARDAGSYSLFIDACYLQKTKKKKDFPTIGIFFFGSRKE